MNCDRSLISRGRARAGNSSATLSRNSSTLRTSCVAKQNDWMIILRLNMCRISHKSSNTPPHSLHSHTKFFMSFIMMSWESFCEWHRVFSGISHIRLSYHHAWLEVKRESFRIQSQTKPLNFLFTDSSRFFLLCMYFYDISDIFGCFLPHFWLFAFTHRLCRLTFF